MSSTIDPSEIEFFSKMAEEWWNPEGKFKPIHKLNPSRIEYIKEKIIDHYGLNTSSSKPFKNLILLDVGCGGGLLSEPMAKFGAKVTGIDAAEKNIKIASAHAMASGLGINYRHSTAEQLLKELRTENDIGFDVILNMEVIEHVSDLNLFIESCAMLLKKDGMMIFSTLNRTAISYCLAIVGAEYILGWLPKGTHDWKKFVTPSELKISFRSNDLKIDDLHGMKYNPIFDSWSLSEDTNVNYIGKALKINS